MAEPKDFGPIYWHTIVYPVKPKEFWERSETQEIEGQYRGGVGIALRLPLTRLGLVLGRWKTRYEESQALTHAIAGRAMAQTEVDWDTVRFGVLDEDS